MIATSFTGNGCNTTLVYTCGNCACPTGGPCARIKHNAATGVTTYRPLVARRDPDTRQSRRAQRPRKRRLKGVHR